MKRFPVSLILAGLLLAACNPATAVPPTTAPTYTPQPTYTPNPTPTPYPTPTPLPTATVVPTPTPQPLTPYRYFPLELGNQWVYSWTNDLHIPSPVVETISVTELEENTFILTYKHNRMINGEYRIRVEDDLGYQWRGGGSWGRNPFPTPMVGLYDHLSNSPQLTLFPASFYVGDTWSETGYLILIDKTECTFTSTVVTSAAAVAVDGYTYDDCLQIQTTITGTHAFAPGERSTWFAPDVGLVKLIYSHVDGSVTTGELVSASIVDH